MRNITHLISHLNAGGVFFLLCFFFTFFFLLIEYVCLCFQEKGGCAGEPTNEETFKIRADKQRGNDDCVTVFACMHVCVDFIHCDGIHCPLRKTGK